MSNDPKRVEELISALKQQRDELALHMHLAKAEAKDEYERLTATLADLTEQYAPVKDAAEETAGNVWAALRLAGEEIGHGFQRLRKAL
jgi:hypothetical protein